MTLNDTFTSTGHKFFAHQEVMAKLRNGKGQPIVTHIMLTDVCNHTCAFCSVQARAGNSLSFDAVIAYLAILKKYGLKAVIFSGGGNPILYKDSKTLNGDVFDFNDAVTAAHGMGLEIGLITNGMPLREYRGNWEYDSRVTDGIRESWKTVRPETLDKLTWIRISMAGLDHDEREVYVPDIDPSKTTLGFSYVAHDIYREPLDPYHGKVSTKHDLIPPLLTPFEGDRSPDWSFDSRVDDLTEEIEHYVRRYDPRYVRLLPNCLEPKLIPRRCEQLLEMANCINNNVGKEVVFVQQKPPKAPHACYLGYIHPVLNCDGYVYPCDSCVLNEAAEHQFANPWRICHWSEIAKIYDAPVRSLIADPAKTCPGCVFTQSNEILRGVVNGTLEPRYDVGLANLQEPKHVNFV